MQIINKHIRGDVKWPLIVNKKELNIAYKIQMIFFNANLSLL